MQARTDRLHDLPPRWDGRIVVWQGWHAQPPAFICPPPKPHGSRRRPGEPRVFRCPDCRHDEVHDGDTDRLWELDDSDYGDDGSVDPDLAERGL